MSSARPCKRCGIKIEFLEGPNGRAIPVQRVRQVYLESAEKRGPAVIPVSARFPGAVGPYFVSHFETCPRGPTDADVIAAIDAAIDASTTEYRLVLRELMRASDAVIGQCDCIMDERGETKRHYYAVRDYVRDLIQEDGVDGT